jgi:hypothetical protein
MLLLVVEDRYVADYSIYEQNTEPDTLYSTTTKAVRASKNRKNPMTKKNQFHAKRKVFYR